jgi:outer membrane protein
MPNFPEPVMKRVLVVGVLLAAVSPLAAQGPSAAPRPLKIAFVNAQQVLQSTPGYQAAESTFNHDVASYRSELQKLQASLDSAVQAFDQQSIALSPAAKQQKQRDLKAMQDRFDQRTQALNLQAQQRQQELISPIQAKINTIIQAIRLEDGYAAIFNSDPQASGLIAFEPALDITQKVLDRIQKLPAQSQ